MSDLLPTVVEAFGWVGSYARYVRGPWKRCGKEHRALEKILR